MDTIRMIWLLAAILVVSMSGSVKSRPEVITATGGAVAADDGRCSVIGADVLREGGHAIDAAIAAALCLGVVSPSSSGIGGGAFVVLRSANGSTHAYDGRETAPLHASENMFAGNPDEQESGPQSIAVPGEVAALYEIWKQHGKLEWERLVKPSAYLAKYGFEISHYLYSQMHEVEEGIMADKGLKEVFTRNGTLMKPGSICRIIKLAETLSLIGRYGANAFYNGSIARNMIRDIREAGGNLTLRDLKQYRVKERKPLYAEIWGHQIVGMPPPSSGGASMMLALNILSKFGTPKSNSNTLDLHRFIEAMKHAFAVRMNLGDPDFVDNISEVVSDMMSAEFAQELQKTIVDNMTFNSSYYGGRWNQIPWEQIHNHGTSHLSVIDKERNAVAMTLSLNNHFGAHWLSPSTGIVMNNHMHDFSVPGDGIPPPPPSNFIRPGKRPLSSMSPTIVVKDGKLKVVVGGSGGRRIIASTTAVLLNYLSGKMNPMDSVLAPRSYHQLTPNVVEYENERAVSGDHIEVPYQTREALKGKGHDLISLTWGAICQLIVQNGNTLTAVSDPRKGGFPSGYDELQDSSRNGAWGTATA